MKITKLIREFVEEEVSKVYDTKVNPYEEQARDDAEAIQAFKEKLKAQQEETAAQFMAEFRLFRTDYNGNVHPFNPSYSIPSFYGAKTQSMLDAEKWKSDIRQAKKEKIREIILALELGANRQELIDMIAKLTEVDVDAYRTQQ